MQKFFPYLKKIFAGANHPVFFAALVVSFGLWYLNKLGHTYTATVVLPVAIESGPDEAVGVLENENSVECRVEGTGYELFRYRMFPRRNVITLNLRNIDLRPVEGSTRSEASHSSIFNAISAQLTDIRLLSLLTPRIEITTAPYHTKKVPVRSRIEVEFRDQYMAVGPTELVPDSIEIRSLGVLLDTLQAVYTERQAFSGVNGSLTGRIALLPIRDAVFPVDEVEFHILAEAYTEVDMPLPLTLHNAPGGRLPVILPDEVTVRLNVARSRYAGATPDHIRAWIDYDDRETNVGKQYKVYVPVPEGIVLKEITPFYVELVFEEL